MKLEKIASEQAVKVKIIGELSGYSSLEDAIEREESEEYRNEVIKIKQQGYAYLKYNKLREKYYVNYNKDFKPDYDSAWEVNIKDIELFESLKEAVGFRDIDRGTTVLVRNSEDEEWEEATFVVYLPNTEWYYVTNERDIEKATFLRPYKMCKLI